MRSITNSRPEPSFAPSLERILAVRLDNIGDVVMVGPALRALREAYPQARITLLASPAGSQVAPLLPWVDQVITWRAVWQDISKGTPVTPEKEYELVHLLEQGGFDAAFIFTSFSQSPHPPAYACYLAGIPKRVGQSKEFGGALLSHWVPPLSDSTHQVDRNLHLLRSAGIPADSSRLELRVPQPDQQSADTLLSSLGIEAYSPFLAIAPGASATARRYDEERFAEVVRWVHEQAAIPVVLLGSAREEWKYPTLEALSMREPLVHNLVGQTSVPEMAAVIHRAGVVLANNSGSMHIASALDRPMVILFAGTEVLEQWAPNSAHAHLLNRETDCSPCYNFQCPYAMECLDIPAEEVAKVVLNLFNTSAVRPARWAAGTARR